MDDQSKRNGKLYPLQRWLGKAQRQHMLMKFIQICFGLALLILGAFVLLLESARMATAKHPPGEPMTLGNITSAEDFRQLAAQEATLAKVAVTSEGRAQHDGCLLHAFSGGEGKDRGDDNVAIKDPSNAPFTNETEAIPQLADGAES